MRQRTTIWIAAAGLAMVAGCSGQPSTEAVKNLTPVNVALPTTSGTPTQIAAAEAMGRIGTPAVPALVEALRDPNPIVRMQACKALAYMGTKGKDAVPALMQTLGDSEETIRIEAADALGQIGDPSQPAVPTLLQMLRTQ
jgi:HEAT repeat protein